MIQIYVRSVSLDFQFGLVAVIVLVALETHSRRVLREILRCTTMEGRLQLDRN
jgi:hypothetical protein